MTSHVIKILTRMAAQALKNPKTRDLGIQLSKELAGTRTRNKAIITAAKITKKDPKIRIFKDRLPPNAMESEKNLFWNLIKSKEFEQIKYPTKDITMRKGVFYNKRKDIASPSYYTGFKKTPMVDIDLPSPGIHTPAQITFNTRKGAINNILDYVKTDRASKFRVYDTPGGIRVFNLANRTPGGPTSQTRAIDRALGGDKYYRNMADTQEVFHARLMPKAGRENDFVARLLGDIGSGAINPKNLQEVTRYHDDLIKIILNQTEAYGYPTSGGLFSLMKFVG